MSNSALITMILVQVLFTVITCYFFYKVFKAPAKEEPDSYKTNNKL